MALSFYSNTNEIVSLDEFIEEVNQRIKLGDEESLLSCTDILFKLANNTKFLADFINKSLSENYNVFQENNNYSEHYAKTLNNWRNNFNSSLNDIKNNGFDDRFIRLWNYYLAYCESGFKTKRIGLNQIKIIHN